MKKILIGNFKGPRGETGIQGPPGQKGNKGDKGDPGEPGLNGRDGVTETPTSILQKIKTVDGENSGLDADTLDGYSSEEFAQQEDLESNIDEIKNTRVVIGRYSDLAGEEGTGLTVPSGSKIYGRIITSNPNINTIDVEIFFIVNGKRYNHRTNASGYALLDINLSPGAYVIHAIVIRGAAGDNYRLEQTKLLTVKLKKIGG